MTYNLNGKNIRIPDSDIKEYMESLGLPKDEAIRVWLEDEGYLENEGYKADIVAYLTSADAPKTIKEMQADVPSLAGLTNQRITHMLTDLVKSETIHKDYVKKVPYFSIA